jgi:hypothetical protein
LFGHRIIGGYLFGKTNSQDYTTGGDIIGPAAYFKENMFVILVHGCYSLDFVSCSHKL